jgi:hypothetical protein
MSTEHNRRPHRCAAAIVTAVTVILKLAAGASAAGMIWVHLCGSWTPGTSRTGGAIGVAQSAAGSGMSTPDQCPSSQIATGLEVITKGSNVADNVGGRWEISAPPAFSIVGAHTVGQEGMVTYGVDSGWYSDFFWQGGRSAVHSSQTDFSSPAIASPYLGWEVVCRATTCDGVAHPAEIAVLEMELEASETAGPTLTITPASLGAASGWIRGWWPIAFSADGPSGACQLSATLGGIGVSQPVNEPQSQTIWHQCPAGSFSQSFNTASVSSGASVPLVMWARDAAYDYTAGAYLSGTVTKSINIDNDPVAINLSGPTDAPSTASIQYVTASATAGPSGVQGISCTVDGSPAQFYSGASARVPVSGIGEHSVRCAADDNAVDASGGHGWSDWASWSMSIRQPTVSGIGFSKLVDAMLCHRVRERVRIPAHWVTAHRGHKRIRVKERSHVQVVTVSRCHARLARRKVTVWTTATRHGKRVRVAHRKTIRVVVMPHVVTHTTKRIAHGKSTTVDGWVGMPNGTALAGQRIRVLTAPDNGQGEFSQVAVATTRVNGSWSARLPAGPSRLVEAAYGGAPTLEPSTSGQVHVVVPAKVKLISVSPARIAWGGTVRIVGKLDGGYLPPGGALVRLRLGQGSGYTTYGVQEYVTGTGRFATTYTFGAGLPSIHQTFWFQIASLPMGGDYPWAPSNSRKLDVIVGGHPSPPPPRTPRHRT